MHLRKFLEKAARPKKPTVFNLKDPAYEASMKGVYESLEDLRPIVDFITNTNCFVSSFLNSNLMYESVLSAKNNASSDVRNILTYDVGISPGRVAGDSFDAIKTESNYLDVKGEEVELLIASTTVGFAFGTGPASLEPEKIKKHLMELLPQINFGQWGVNKKNDVKTPKIGTGETSKRFTANQIINWADKVNFTPLPKEVNGEMFQKLDYSEFKNKFLTLPKNKSEKALPKVEVNISVLNNAMDFKFARYDDQVRVSGLEEISGETKSMSGIVIGRLKLDWYIKVPVEYALWATETYEIEKFLPKLLVDLFNKKKLAATDSRKRGAFKAPVRIGRYSNVDAKNRKAVSVFKTTIKPRTNEDGICIVKNGSIKWIPNVNAVSEYESKIKSAYDPIKKITESSKISDFMIYTDWRNDKFTFTSSEGSILDINLSGAIPLDITTKNRMLQTDFLSLSTVIQAMDNYLYSIGENQTSILGLANRLKATPLFAQNDSKIEIYLFYAATTPNAKSESGYDFSEQEKNMLSDIFEAATKIMNKWDSIPNKNVTTATTMYPWILGIAKYAKEYRKVFNESRELYAKNSQVYDLSEFKIPNIKIEPGKFEAFMPHQAEILSNVLSSKPSALQVEVAPGGGKTIMYIAEILTLINSGDVKRPLVIVPSNLMRQLVEEIASVSSGNVNSYVLTKYGIQRDLEVGGFTMDQVVSRLKDPNTIGTNTIFITSYEQVRSTFGFKGLDEFSGTMIYGEKEIERYPFADFLSALEFDYILCDESQRIKKSSSSQNKAVLILMANAKYKRIASGTSVNNTVTDLTGQMAALNPAALGDEERFSKMYGVSKNAIIDTITGDRIRRNIKSYVRQEQKKRRSWSYLLPTLIEQVIPTSMTPKQSEFYDRIMEIALLKIKSDLKDKTGFEDGDTLSDDEEQEAEKIFKRNLNNVEIYLAAPDEVEDYVNWEKKPKGEDLISPKVRLANQIMLAHFNMAPLTIQDTKIIPDPTNKILVLSYRKISSRHMMRHLDPKLRGMTVHYTSGDKAAVAAFISNPDIKIMVADEASIQVGFNFQMASRIIRLETLWSPGDQEQALSRVIRPDPRGIYNRESLNYNWIITTKSDGESTIDVAKTGRLFSKISSNAQYDNSENPRWNNIGKQVKLPIIRMNMDLLVNFDNRKLEEFFTKYQLLKAWESREFDTYRMELAKKTEERTGQKIVTGENSYDRNKLIKYAMLPVTEGGTISGSKEVATPLIPGQKYESSKFGKMVPLADIAKEIEYNDDNKKEVNEEDADSIDNDEIEIRQGMPVITSDGLAILMTNLKKGARVEVQNYKGKGKKIVTYPKTAVFTSPDDDIQKQMLRSMRGSKVKSEKPAPKEEKKTKPQEQFDNSIKVAVVKINNKPSLVVQDPDEKIDREKLLTSTRGWRELDPFYAFLVETPAAMIKFIKKLQEDYSIPDDRLKDMQDTIKVFKREDRLRMAEYINIGELKNFFLLEKKPIPEAKGNIKQTIRPYIIIFNENIMVCFDRKTHQRYISGYTSELAKIPNVRYFRYIGWLVNFFEGSNPKKDAMKDLEQINEVYPVSNYSEAQEKIEALRIFKPTDTDKRFGNKEKTKEKKEITLQDLIRRAGTTKPSNKKPTKTTKPTKTAAKKPSTTKTKPKPPIKKKK